MQGFIEVNDPVDDVEMDYAIERVITVAQENGMENDEIESVLKKHVKAVNEDRL